MIFINVIQPLWIYCKLQKKKKKLSKKILENPYLQID